MLVLILGFTLLGSILSVLPAASLLRVKGKRPTAFTAVRIPDAIGALLGAVLTYFLLPVVGGWIPYWLSLSAASFIYAALADRIPGRRSGGGLRSFHWELPLIGLGAARIVAFHLELGPVTGAAGKGRGGATA